MTIFVFLRFLLVLVAGYFIPRLVGVQWPCHDSEATFEQQAIAAGLSQPWIDALKGSGLATMAKLSFAVTTPGTVASDADVTAFLQRIRAGVAPAISDLSSFKRILFEAQTLMVHHLKSAVKGDDVSVKKMAPPERDARLASNVPCSGGLTLLVHWSLPMLFTICAAI